MTDKSQLIIYEEQTFTVGQGTFIDSTAENNNAVVFEDNEGTGYFYAVDRSSGLQILDALHIYNAVNVIDKEKPSTVKILWTEDLNKAFLSINNYYHAFFDFMKRAGYCRTGFPKANSKWTLVSDRLLTDELIIELFRTKAN
jgi:hypothetical protein